MIVDPIKLIGMIWPDIVLYDKQVEIVYSFRDNDETVVTAGNALGKDFISALIALTFFISRRPARVVTTSVKMNQLDDVLWGEIRRFLRTASVNLPIHYNHLHIRQKDDDGALVPQAELVGQVTNKDEGLLGRHLPRGPNGEPTTAAIFDEASAIDDGVYRSTETWAHRKLIIGNPFDCTNFFYQAVKEGDIPRENGKGFHRKVIKITAEDSPNVQYAYKEQRNGKEPSDKILIPGVKAYSTYMMNRKLWDPELQCVGLDAEFYEGTSTRMFPPDWLAHSISLHKQLEHQPRQAVAMGVDTAEGGDSTTFTVSDGRGIIKQESLKTPDTSVIVPMTINYINRYNIPPERVMFDAGGGGKQHADQLRQKGYNVRTVAFGGAATPQKSAPRAKDVREDVQDAERRYIYKNKRAELYGKARLRIDPTYGPGFAIPEEYQELTRQLSLIPLKYDDEGRLKILPKNRTTQNKTEPSLTEIIGHSPDEADSFVLSIYGLEAEPEFVFLKRLF